MASIGVKRLRVAGLGLVAALGLSPTAMHSESLTQALVSAYTNSGLLQQQQALLRAKDEDVAIAVAATRPVFSYSLASKWTNSANTPITTPTTTSVSTAVSATASLAASLTIWNGGANQLKIKLANENVLMARETLRGVEQKVLLRAVQAFLNMRSAHETAVLQANNVRVITQELRAARDRFDVGEITQTDVSLAEARLAAAKSAEAAARGQLMVAREEYKAAIGHYPNGLQVPPALPAVPRTLAAAKAAARTNHPDVLAAQRAVTVAGIGTDIARASMKPSVTASASVSRTLSSTYPKPTFGTVSNDAAGAGLSVTLSGPIYAGGKLSAIYRQARAQAEASRAALHVATIGVEQNVGNAWAQLAIATASLQSSAQQVRASQVALRGAREEATLGARTTLEVLTFEQDLLNAQASNISAQSNQYVAVYSLLAAEGKLTAANLGLGVGYDNAAYYNAVKSAPVYEISPQGQRLDAVMNRLGVTP